MVWHKCCIHDPTLQRVSQVRRHAYRLFWSNSQNTPLHGLAIYVPKFWLSFFFDLLHAPAKGPLVVARRACNFLFRHIGCRNVMRSRECAMQNQRITLKFHVRRCAKPCRVALTIRLTSDSPLVSILETWCCVVVVRIVVFRNVISSLLKLINNS